jgi:Na+-transporting methylmalonyl-CoA/oxaloacetate decarboxylase gamma subunit
MQAARISHQPNVLQGSLIFLLMILVNFVPIVLTILVLVMNCMTVRGCMKCIPMRTETAPDSG